MSTDTAAMPNTHILSTFEEANLPGVTDLKLSRDAYAGIFLGKITKWNDPAIAKDNPGVTLPDLPINVSYRSDGSGTTFVFTKHLAAISKDFADEVGSDKSVTWPVVRAERATKASLR